jgi:hypothetical protein
VQYSAKGFNKDEEIKLKDNKTTAKKTKNKPIIDLI